MTGTLVLIATPIGNLGDLSVRAADALRNADAIVCEDTRRTSILLQHIGLSGTKMIVANEHTEMNAVRAIERLLTDGRNVAVVSDAGLPGISDPGERIVRAAIAIGATVTAVPGPSAAVTALVVSGLPSDRHVMEGFLPRQGPERRSRLGQVGSDQRTVVLYEAPHRLARTLTDLTEVCGASRPVVLVRELTKMHEEIWRGSLGDAVALVGEREPRGEYVIVLGGAPDAPPPDQATIEQAIDDALASGLSGRDAAADVAAALGVPKRDAYAVALARRAAR
jgi:16S rRNA (cytidine1402-2'-O)-methyltransferase